MPKVSIIVPIYNVEKYLPECVESIRRQTLDDIEILLVDDESPDNCPQMIDEYAKKDDRIVPIHQKNKWLGGARNAGLKIAKGEYLCCIDADDYISPDFCEKLYNFATTNTCDVSAFAYCIVNDKGDRLAISNKRASFPEKNIYYGEEIPEIVFPILLESYNLNFSTSFFHRKIIEAGFLFDETIRYAEDYEAALRVYKLANSVGYLDEPLYYYRQNDESIMHVIKFERLKQIIYLFELREKFIAENGLGTQENLFHSAHLLIKLFIEKFPMIFGIKDKKYATKKAEIIDILNDHNLQTAMSRIAIKHLDMGIFGKLCFWAMKIKCPLLIIGASSVYNRRA